MAEQKISSDTGLESGAHAHALALLRFQIEAGADECIEEIPTALVAPSPAPESSTTAAATPAIKAKPAAPISYDTPIEVGGAASLTELAETCAGFDCDLRRTATNMVFADGNPDAALMLVGEAPGAEEDRTGKPFVGASGRLLDRMLASIGLDRGSVYITNILNWRPPGNRTPTREEVALFLPVIKKHIALAAPKVILALGGSAAKTLLGREEGILKLRGRWHDYDMGDGKTIPLLPSLHPSYLLRSPGQKQLAWQDLRMLARALDGRDTGTPQ